MTGDPRRERITVENDRRQRLAARLDLPPDDEPQASAVLAHCFTCSKDLRALRLIADALAGAGFAVLRLDFTGLGASEGNSEETTFSSNVSDLLAGLAALREHVAGPQLLVGHSLGGAASLAAALREQRVAAVAAIGAPATPGHVLQLLEGGVEAIERDGVARVDIGGRSFTIGRALLDHLRDADLPGALRDLRQPSCSCTLPATPPSASIRLGSSSKPRITRRVSPRCERARSTMQHRERAQRPKE